MVVGTLSGAILGAIAGSLGTYLLQEHRRKKQEKEEVENLRNSLLAELSCMDDLLSEDHDDRDDIVQIGMSIPSNVFESNSSTLSILESKETERVIRFYSGALKYQKMVEELTDLLADGDKSPENILKKRGGKEKIQDEWIRCVVSLLEHSDGYPESIQFEGREIEPNEDIGFEDLWIFLNYDGISDKGMDAEPVRS